MSGTAPHREDPPEPTPANMAELFDRARPRLERTIAVRIDPHLRRRVDPADVLQEAYLLAAKELADFLERRPMPLFLWLRQLTGRALFEFHRRHLDAERRDAARDVPLGGFPAASSASMAGVLIDRNRTPFQAAARAEAQVQLEHALAELEELDREVLALRYFEGLSNEEAASVLGLTPSGAKKRHLRALRRLRSFLPRSEDVPTP